MEYCSTVPPLQQVTDSKNQPLPSVLVPVSVLKREGKYSNMFKFFYISSNLNCLKIEIKLIV